MTISRKIISRIAIALLLLSGAALAILKLNVESKISAGRTNASEFIDAESPRINIPSGQELLKEKKDSGCEVDTVKLTKHKTCRFTYRTYVKRNEKSPQQDIKNMVDNLQKVGWGYSGATLSRFDAFMKDKNYIGAFPLWFEKKDNGEQAGLALHYVNYENSIDYDGLKLDFYKHAEELKKGRYFIGFTISYTYYSEKCFFCRVSKAIILDEEKSAAEDRQRDEAEERIKADYSYETTKIRAYSPGFTPPGFTKEKPFYNVYGYNSIVQMVRDQRNKTFSITSYNRGEIFKNACQKFYKCEEFGRSVFGTPVFRGNRNNFYVKVNSTYVQIQTDSRNNSTVIQPYIMKMINSLKAAN